VDDKRIPFRVYQPQREAASVSPLYLVCDKGDRTKQGLELHPDLRGFSTAIMTIS
jgi:hypothetical protein